MAAGEQTTRNELSLDLSLLYEQDNCQAENGLRELSSSSTEHDDMEELVITEQPPPTKHSESTKLDLSCLSGSSSGSSGPSISRDRHTASSLPSVHQRPFMACEAWSGTETDSERKSRRTTRTRAVPSNRTSSEDNVKTNVRQTSESASKSDKLPYVPMNNISVSTSVNRPRLPQRGIAFGSSFVRDSNYHNPRLFGRSYDQPRTLPPFLKAHTRERRLRSLSLNRETETEKPKQEEQDKIAMPKDFATLHLLARRAQGHLRYRYMAMLNEWIAEHGIPTT